MPPKDEWEIFRANMETLEALSSAGAVKAAYPVGPGGVAASLAVMAFGNMTGVEAYAESFSRVNFVNYQGSILAEIDKDALSAGLDSGSRGIPAGRTLREPVFRIVPKAGFRAVEVSLEMLRRAYESPLAQVYPQTSMAAEEVRENAIKPPGFKGDNSFFQGEITHRYTHGRTHSGAVPLAALPVFPGTNCEWDMERAFRAAGAKTRLVIFRNQSREDIRDSLKELAAAIKEAQIVALSGGFSAGDEPDGSGKFIANVLRAPPIAEALTDFLEKRDGLMLGICNGFQALIKTGLVPYGRVTAPDGSMPTLTFNAIGRHVSRMVRTRVMPNNSPWLSLEAPGAIHVIPVSHGEGRLAMRPEEAETLFARGQVPFCYADAGGNPAMTEPDNPNGSAFAIEGISSPDGRVLGKMGHSERCGELVHINIPGNKRQSIFEAGVKYFT
jgi:phosphoribosylformylglycinamidine synthase